MRVSTSLKMRMLDLGFGPHFSTEKILQLTNDNLHNSNRYSHHENSPSISISHSCFNASSFVNYYFCHDSFLMVSVQMFGPAGIFRARLVPRCSPCTKIGLLSCTILAFRDTEAHRKAFSQHGSLGGCSLSI